MDKGPKQASHRRSKNDHCTYEIMLDLTGYKGNAN